MGKYQLVRRLAVGGMAEVFLAKAAGPMGFEKELVVKRILPHLVEDPQFIQMFLTEAKVAARLNHGNVVQIFDFGEQEDSYFIAMEYIDGLDLKTLLKRASQLGVPIPYPIIARIISMACDGLAYAHDLTDPQSGKPLGFIHRDISTDNILVSLTGGVKVVDFGIAKAANMGQPTQSGLLKGKVSYMPPEYLLNHLIDLRADIYALGVVLYELIAGRKPFVAESEMQLVQLIIQGKPADLRTLRPDVPTPLVQIIERALQKDREARYANCRQMQADLEHFLFQSGEPVGALQIAEWVKPLALMETAPARRKSQESLAVPSGVAQSPLAGTRPLKPPQPTDFAQSQEDTLVTPRPFTNPTEDDEELLKLIARPRWHRLLALAMLGVVVAGTAIHFFTQEPAQPTSAAALPPIKAQNAPPKEDLPPPTPAITPGAPPSIASSDSPTPITEPPPSTPLPTGAEKGEPAAPAQELAILQAPKPASGEDTAPRGPTQLHVVSNLPARVRINGSIVGSTPWQKQVSPGRKQIEVFGKAGRRLFSKVQSIEIADGETRVPFSFRLLNVQVRGLPPGTKVLSLDDESLDHEDRVATYEGLHELVLVRASTGRTNSAKCEVNAAEKVCMFIRVQVKVQVKVQDQFPELIPRSLDGQPLDKQNRVETYEGWHTVKLVQQTTGKTFQAECQAKAGDKECRIVPPILSLP